MGLSVERTRKFNHFEIALKQKLSGKPLNKQQQEDLEVFERTFGSCEPLSESKFTEATGENAEEYKEYLFGHTMDIQQKVGMITGITGILLLDYIYANGAILFFDKKHPKYPNTLIVVINDEGEQEAESEKLGMDVSTRYLDRRIHFIKRNGIIGVTMKQHLCVDPDCKNCKGNRDAPTEFLPYILTIETNAGRISAFVGDFLITSIAIDSILSWMSGTSPAPRSKSLSKKKRK